MYKVHFENRFILISPEPDRLQKYGLFHKFNDTSELYKLISDFHEDKKIEMTDQNLYKQILGSNSISRKVKIVMFESLRRFMGGQNIDLFSIIACPQCKKGFSENYSSRLICEKCKVEYPLIHGIPILLKEKAMVLNIN